MYMYMYVTMDERIVITLYFNETFNYLKAENLPSKLCQQKQTKVRTGFYHCCTHLGYS